MTEPTNEQTLPEMQPGSSGMYSISAADGIQMGPAVLQAFMKKLREAAEAAQLEVKVEPLRGLLMIWWVPMDEGKPTTYLDGVVDTLSKSERGDAKASKAMLLGPDDNVRTMQQLCAFFEMTGELLKKRIRVVYTGGGDEVSLSWAPLGEDPGWDSDWVDALAKREPTFLDDLVEHMGVVPEGEVEVTLDDIASGELQTLEELTEALKMVGRVKNSSITVRPEMTGESMTIHIEWSPLLTDENDN